jgi:hypothetical protein
MSDDVTPVAGEPVGLPGLQTTSDVPNAPAFDPEAVVVSVPEVGVVLELVGELLRPHAASAIAMTQTNANHRKCFTSPPHRPRGAARFTNLTTRQVVRECPL